MSAETKQQKHIRGSDGRLRTAKSSQAALSPETLMSRQLLVTIKDGQLQISIGIALLAFAVQAQDAWPEDWYVNDISLFAESMARQLMREEEDGTTRVHRMLDAAADEVLEQGDYGIHEGDVSKGIELAKAVLDGETAPQPAAAPAFDTSRNVSEDEIRQWAATRADDAGYLARQLIALKDRKGADHDKA